MESRATWSRAGEITIEQVEAALERMERGGYGRCERCQRDISPERLDALPFTRYCKDCASQQELSTIAAP
jgi:DnaK suppressor protein